MYPADITLRITRLSMLELLALGNNVLAKLEDNSAFPEPPVPLPEMAHLIGRFQGLISLAERGSKHALLLRNACAEDVRNMLTHQAYYVRSRSDRDPALLATSGFPLRKIPQSLGPLTAPVHLRARTGNAPGHVGLWWKPVKGAIMYEVFALVNGPGDVWQLVATIGRASYSVSGLTTDTRYMFKVRPMGRDGLGPESGVVSAIAA
ncbi:MAG: fibronectin type III domain-containing protein [Flavobacteriales bacterium]|nr:fibronectin type III domain-containing protein [Flavobacteriales bacterium]